MREGAVEVNVYWDPGRACAVRPRYVSVKGDCCWLILVPGPCARGRMCCEACTRALRDNFAMHGACRFLDKEHLRRHVVSKGGCVVECRAAQLRVDRRHEELHWAYEAGRIVKTLMAFFLKWFAEERQARLELFIWDCISSRRNARKVPLCRRGLTVKNTPSTRRAAWAWACPGMPGHPNPRARVSEVPSALGLPPSPLPQSSLAPSAAVCCRSCG